jgi:glycosyltransferase involved in cell wall biosynthesis
MQDYLNWECVIVDDGSNDDSPKLAKDFINSTSGNWILLRKENNGPSSARNFGVLNSKGEFIAFLDSDDIWMPNKLSRQLSDLLSSPSCLVSLTDYVITQGNTIGIKGVRSSKHSNLLIRWLNMRGFGGLVESTGLIRRRVFDAGIYFDETLSTGEGLDFMLRISSLGNFCVVPDYLTIYRLSEGQLHKNESLVKMNSKKLGEKYASNPKQLNQILVDQEKYFALSNLRNISRLRLVLTISRHIARLDLPLMSVAGSIISRNLQAKLISKKTKRQIDAARKRLNRDCYP